MHKQLKCELTIRQSKGFTLIELLVVIAIIGILASIILASLATARSKGADARIQEQLAGMRSQAELYIGAGTAVLAVTPCAATSGTLFDTGSNGLGTLLNGLTLANVRCASATGKPNAGAQWAVAAATSNGAWCVDYTGASGSTNNSGAGYTTTLTSAIAAGTTVCL
jgi:prepilin-type N-terminal cleavage/methylation domain-containing protein